MGMFNYLRSRRERESGIPSADAEEIIGKLESNDAPVGQQLPGTQAQSAVDLGAFGLGTGGVNLLQVMGMVKDAYKTGGIQIAQGENQVLDLRGTGDGEALRAQILETLKQHGIEPGVVPDGSQADAGDYSGLQQQILDTLKSHGVDVDEAGTQSLPDGWDTGGEGSR